MKPPRFASVILALALMSTFAHAQTPTDIPVLQGLSPVNALGKSNAGQSALGANYALTGGIERGEVAQPTLLPFVEQEGQALQDAFIASKNLANLADGLGTTLGAAYVARLHYLDQNHASPIPEALSNLINYATSVTLNAGAGKCFFANGPRNGTDPVSPEAQAILTSTGGTTDIFGVSYGLPTGTPGADKYGNSRPFQTDTPFAVARAWITSTSLPTTRLQRGPDNVPNEQPFVSQRAHHLRIHRGNPARCSDS
jgi:hypothetical protein